MYLSFQLYRAVVQEVSIELDLSYEFFSYDRHDRYNDMETMTRKNCSCKWGIVDKFSLSRKIWRASFSLTRKNCQVRNLLVMDGQQGKCGKDIIDF